MEVATKRVALVTGGSRGIGLGIAQALAASGFRVAINGRRSPGEVQPVMAELANAGAEPLYLRADVGDVSGHQPMLDAIRARYGRLDVLVNNAGVAPEVRADVLDAMPESFDRLIRINLRGPYFLTQSVAKWMVEQRRPDPAFRGCVVNVSSVSATQASTNRGDYCISKAGVAMATRLWAMRLAEFGIDVYEVRPGVVSTDMTAAVKAKYDAMIAAGLTLENRWGTPEDIGRAVAMLARGDMTYATGQVLTIDGGLSLPRL